jgi:hypothetical protein
MANEGSTRMTTDQLRAMIAGGATREQLPASGSSVSSTVDSAQRAYLAAQQKVARTAAFKLAQTQTARTISQARTAQMQSVADNSKNLPNFDAQNQTITQCTPTVNNYCKTNLISNNNVNPSSLFVPQRVNVTGQSKNSSVNVGINSNANYNYATQLNDYQTLNPNSQVNLGQEINEPYFTAGLSSIPNDNEVKTSLLGGDIQHQETDVNTNLEYELPLAQQSTKNVNWDFAQSITAGSAVIPLTIVGLIALVLGKKK